MSTNILAIPLAQISVETGTNEDWIDSILYLVGPEAAEMPQFDLRGIEFEMEIRRQATDHEVIMNASTQKGTLAIGPPPDFGYLLILIPVTDMLDKQPGDYVGDVVATADGFARRVILLDLKIVEGVTR